MKFRLSKFLIGFFICFISIYPSSLTIKANSSADSIEIDFDRVAKVPMRYRQSIRTAIETATNPLAIARRIVVSAFRLEGDFFEVFLVPTRIIDSHWETDVHNEEILEVVGYLGDSGLFVAHLRGEPDFIHLETKIPTHFSNLAQVKPSAIEAVDYLFPWTSGQSWYKTQGWHNGWTSHPNSIDFQPIQRTNPAIHFAVLSAATGRVTEICKDGQGAQSVIQIEHSEGWTRYLHLDQNTIRRDLLGQNVSRGQFIGSLYNGRQGSGSSRCGNTTPCQFDTLCGFGTAFHLHFELSDRNNSINGHNANTISSAAFATPFASTNQRSDGTGQSPNCQDGEGVVLFENTNHSGRCIRLTSDDDNLSDNSFDNLASSVKIIGNYRATLHENSGYTGASSTIYGDDPDLSNEAIQNRRASSIRIERTNPGGPTSNCDGGQGVYLYEHGNYGGKCSKFTGDNNNLGGMYIGDNAASSIKFIGNYEAVLHENNDYTGASSVFTADDSDFGNDAIGVDRTSAIRVRERSTATQTSNCDGSDGVYVYEHPNFSGRCTKFASDTPNPSGWYLSNDSASSVEVRGNFEATLYDHDNYNGANSTFVANDADLGNDAIGHDHMSSIRVRQIAAGPTSCPVDELLAEYFANRTLTGAPTLRRCEREIRYDWVDGGPSNSLPNEDFSVRWSGQIAIVSPGTYRFTTRTDDGVRLWLNDQLVIDQWHDMGATDYSLDRNLESGLHTIKMEYYEHSGWASANLIWRIQTTPSAVDSDDGRTLGYDNGLDGSVTPSDDRDESYFEGVSGQAVTIRVNKRDSSLDPYLELYGPNGSLIGSNDDEAPGNLDSRLAVTLQQNGRYKTVVSGYGGSTGGYRISLSRESTGDPDDNRWITIGATLRGTISPQNDRDNYFISATSGRVLSIRMNRVDTTLDSYLELYDPAGNMIANNDDGDGVTTRNSWLVKIIPSTGVYRIVGRSYELSSQGRYDLSVSLASNANMALNKPATATSTEFNGVEPIKAFDGNLQTRWASRYSDPQMIYVDLGITRTVNQVVLKWERAYARQYDVIYWNGSQWINAYSTNAGDGGNDVINTSTPIQTRWIGMRGRQRATNYGYSLWEFEVYNTDGILIPLVPPDPSDKPDESNVIPLIPLGPNDPSKTLTLLIGDGESGQENMPLEELSPDTPAPSPITGLPTAHVMYPLSGTVIYVGDSILFQSVGVDNDEGGDSIVAYEWQSDRDGLLGTNATFNKSSSSMSLGHHVITLRAQDNEGNWSEPLSITLTIEMRKFYLPMVIR